MRHLLPFVALVAALPLPSATAQSSCDLQGAWQLVSARYDNQLVEATVGGIKVYSKTRFAVVGLDTALTGSLATDAERLNFFNSLNAVAGSYSVSGDTWTEKIEYASDPSIIGSSATFHCVREGDRLIQKGAVPIFEGGKKVRDMPLEEIWRQVDRA